MASLPCGMVEDVQQLLVGGLDGRDAVIDVVKQRKSRAMPYAQDMVRGLNPMEKNWYEAPAVTSALDTCIACVDRAISETALEDQQVFVQPDELAVVERVFGIVWAGARACQAAGSMSVLCCSFSFAWAVERYWIFLLAAARCMVA